MTNIKLYVIWLVILIIGLAIVLTPLALIIYGVKKKRPRLIIVTVAVTALIVAGVGVFKALFPTQFPYVDSWIYGKTQEEITERYGQPYYKQEDRVGYYVGDDNGFFGVMDSNNKFYYYIYFDEDGKAYKINEGAQIGG